MPCTNNELTDKELQIVKLIAQGYNRKFIAHKLDIQPSTLKGYLNKISEKFGVSGIINIINYARDNSIIN